jgi:hypothetical protein
LKCMCWRHKENMVFVHLATNLIHLVLGAVH